MQSLDIQAFLVIYVALLFSVCVHETAHAWTADMCGDDTARLLGRVTLNPVVHIDPIGTVLFPILGFFTGFPFIGWAKPVPVNPRRFRNYRRDDILVSLAGIISNLGLALIAAFSIRIFGAVGSQFPIAEPIRTILFYMMFINVALAVFNLIPIPPLDGSHVLYHYLPMQAADQFRMLQQYGYLILMLLLMFGVFRVLLHWPMQIFIFIAGI